jgi:hypothetical protein
MLLKKFPKNLVRAVVQDLQNSQMSIGGDIIKTNIGLPQGAILAPFLHNMFIDQVITEMSKLVDIRAYADDIIIYVKGDLKLNQALIKIQKEFKKIEVKINIKKSYVMQITTSGHMKSHKTGSIMSFPVTKSFKYLGCRLDQAANFKEELSNKKNLVKKLKKSRWLIASNKLTTNTRYHCW